MTHGWPGSIIELVDIIEQLTQPERFGGRSQEAFHLVLPSLPGFGFSGKPTVVGWGVAKIARAWDCMMKRLNYRNYVAQGGHFASLEQPGVFVDESRCFFSNYSE